MVRNYKLTISYDGTRYFGWEHQPDTEMTIQGKIETVLSRMIGLPEDEIVDVIGAGRTDAGVHARGMVANVLLDTERSEAEIMDYLNAYLPDDIAIREVKIASDRFHARYNAVGKTYCYTCYYGKSKPVFDRRYVTVLDQEIDIEAMKEAAKVLTGTHDYASFCGNPKMKKSTVRTVDRIEMKKDGPYLRIYYHGNGFLRYMVRILTGTLLEVGYGNLTADDVAGILAAKERAKAGPTAPAKGLCLIRLDY